MSRDSQFTKLTVQGSMEYNFNILAPINKSFKSTLVDFFAVTSLKFKSSGNIIITHSTVREPFERRSPYAKLHCFIVGNCNYNYKL